MKKIAIITFCLILVLAACKKDEKKTPEEPEKETVKDSVHLDWLEGSWKQINGKRPRGLTEVWEKTDSGYDGFGIEYGRKGDTSFLEQLWLRKINDTLNYVVYVDHNARNVYFPLTEYDSTHLRFENPSHDFPKVIDYKLLNDTLTATVSSHKEERELIFIKDVMHE